MRIRASHLLALLLVLACADVARGEPLRADAHPWRLQATTALVTGVLAVGYTAVFLDRLDFYSEPEIFFAGPISFAAAGSLGIWLAGRWRGVHSSLAATVLSGTLPALFLQVLSLAADRRSGARGFISLLVTPVVSLAGAFLGFESNRADPGGGEGFVLRAVVDERSR